MKTPLQILPAPLALGLILFRGKKRTGIPVATTVSITGIGVGVATLMSVLAVTAGFEHCLRDKILGVYPHLLVLERGDSFPDYEEVTQAVRALPEVKGASPSTYDEMMITSDESSAGVAVKGVDITHNDEVSNIGSLTTQGGLKTIEYNEGEEMGVVVGCKLLSKLKAKVGDTVTLTNPIRGIEGASAGPVGMAPVEARFKVRDCFKSGYYEYDTRLVIMDLKTAQEFLGRIPAVRWIEVKLHDLFETDKVKKKILSALEPFTTIDLLRAILRLQKDMERLEVGKVAAKETEKSLSDLVLEVSSVQNGLMFSDLGNAPSSRFRIIDWKQMNKNLFSALATQKVVLALFFLIIVLVAALNIVTTQLVVAKERLKEISTLVALGSSRTFLYKVFVVHGVVLGVCGVAFGVVLGLFIVSIIKSISYPLDPSIYYIASLPAHVTVSDVGIIAFLSILVVFLSCLVSSARAMRFNPLDGLRKIA
jgi:lipoprotein-releasing system permease protein